MVDGRDRGAIVGAPHHGSSASTFETVARAIAASGRTVRRRIHEARIRARMATRMGSTGGHGGPGYGSRFLCHAVPAASLRRDNAPRGVRAHGGG